MSKKKIGIDNYRLSDISKLSREIKKAYDAYRSSLEVQGIPFGIDLEKIFNDVANAVQINSTIVVPQSKRLELLGVSTQRPRESFAYLLRVMAELGISFEDLDEDGNLSKDCQSRLQESAVIYADGKEAVEYAKIIEEFIAALERLSKHHESKNLNRFRVGAIAQAMNGLIQPNTDGSGFSISPSIFKLYCK
jgi:hypothetical protein